MSSLRRIIKGVVSKARGAWRGELDVRLRGKDGNAQGTEEGDMARRRWEMGGRGVIMTRPLNL